MLHVTASLLLPLNPVMMVLSDGTVTGWIGVLRTSQVNEKGWVGGGGEKWKKNGGNAFHLYMRSVHVELLVNMPDVHERTALAQLEIRRRGRRR